MAWPLRIASASVLLISLHLAGAISLQMLNVQTKVSKPRKCPSLFVAVLTTPDNAARRSEIRPMWTSAGETYANSVKYFYALCRPASGLTPDLQAEQDKYGDMVFLDCEEGYLNGLLTRKVAATMAFYVDNFQDFDLYMKIDDDAYISTDRLCSFMDMLNANGTNVEKAYMGVFAEGHEKLNATHPVIRDETNPWYEPYSKYPDENYPISAKGGPGYILPKSSVQEIIAKGIDKDYELNNEDKSVGYWVTKLQEAKVNHYVNIPGTDGYEEHKQYNDNHNCTKGTFGGYPLTVHHHLEGSQIACLHEIEKMQDPEAMIDMCFQLTLFGIPKEHVRIHMPY